MIWGTPTNEGCFKNRVSVGRVAPQVGGVMEWMRGAGLTDEGQDELKSIGSMDLFKVDCNTAQPLCTTDLQ